MKIMVAHPFLSSHYKNALFEELQRAASIRGHELLVVQWATSERSRAGMGDLNARPAYNYDLLHDGFVEDISENELTRRFLASIRRFGPDVVLLPGFYSRLHWVAIAYLRARGIPVLVANDSTAADNQPSPLKQAFKKLLVRQFAGYFVYGQKAADYLYHLGGHPSKLLVARSAVVDNSTLEQLAATLPVPPDLPPTPYFIYVGRLLSIKGLDTLLDAFGQFHLQYPDWRLVLVGEGEERPTLEKYISDKQLPVHLLGGRSWQGVVPYLRGSEALILPSRSEPWGLVANEAMVCQKPVIVSDKCGCTELVIEGKTGFTFPNGDAAALAQRMAQIADNQATRKQMGKNAYELIQAYSPQQVAEAMLSAFEKFMN